MEKRRGNRPINGLPDFSMPDSAQGSTRKQRRDTFTQPNLPVANGGVNGLRGRNNAPNNTAPVVNNSVTPPPLSAGLSVQGIQTPAITPQRQVVQKPQAQRQALPQGLPSQPAQADPRLTALYDNQNPNAGSLASINYNKSQGRSRPGVIEQPGSYSPADINARQEYIKFRDSDQNKPQFDQTNFDASSLDSYNKKGFNTGRSHLGTIPWYEDVGGLTRQATQDAVSPRGAQQRLERAKFNFLKQKDARNVAAGKSSAKGKARQQQITNNLNQFKAETDRGKAIGSVESFGNEGGNEVANYFQGLERQQTAPASNQYLGLYNQYINNAKGDESLIAKIKNKALQDLGYVPGDR